MPREIIEGFTFRHLDRSVSADAVIDTGAEATTIPPSIANELGLPLLELITVRLADESNLAAHLHRCLVAWTIYEGQGYCSVHDIVCQPCERPLIGMDFLERHQLSVDLRLGGLVGYAPANAEPLTGGGYVVNPPRGFVLAWNAERLKAARPGEVLRPHPAWRFSRPALEARKPAG